MADTFENRERVLRSCFLFADTSADSLKPIVDASRIETHRRGAQIFAADDPADGLRIILSGQVRIWMADADGRELTLSFLGEGDPFGEIALLDGMPRTAHASAVEVTECLFLHSSAMETALEDDPGLARELILSMCELMRRNLETISSFAFVGLDARLAQVLYALAFDHAEIDGGVAKFTRKFSQTDLAQLLGVTREAVNKRFKVLEGDGLVVVNSGHMELPDMQALGERAKILDSTKHV